MSPDIRSIMVDEVNENFEPDSPLSRLEREAAAEGIVAPQPPAAYRLRQVNLFRTPKQTFNDVDMEDVFPAIGHSKPVLNRWAAHQLRRNSAKKRAHMPSTSPIGNMGLFGRLPGELRNEIYRLAFVSQEQPILVKGCEMSCHRGVCVHTRLSVAASGMACTSRQLRKELMPVFCTENRFKFDATMVRTRCAANWVRSMSYHARLVRVVVLELSVIFINPMRQVTASRLLDITIECPAMRTDGRFAITYDPKIPQNAIDQSGLTKLLSRMNEDVGTRGRASKLAFIVGSDELADLVFMCKKGLPTA